jgi:hypothetical protein
MRCSLCHYSCYRIDRLTGRNGATADSSQKRHAQDHVELRSLISVEATGIFLPIGKGEILLAALYKSLGVPRAMQISLSC